MNTSHPYVVLSVDMAQRMRAAQWRDHHNAFVATASVFFRNGLIGANHYGNRTCELRLHANISGSPPPAFGFTKDDPPAIREWPALTLHVSLPRGADALRNELAVRIATLVNDFFKENGLP